LTTATSVFGVGADYLGDKFPLVRQQHLQLVRSLDHVVVGQNVAVRRHDHAGAETLLLAFALLVREAELPKKRIADTLAHGLGGIDRNDGLLHGLNDVGVAGNHGGLAVGNRGGVDAHVGLFPRSGGVLGVFGRHPEHQGSRHGG
jgi:hypothetical protein